MIWVESNVPQESDSGVDASSLTALFDHRGTYQIFLLSYFSCLIRVERDIRLMFHKESDSGADASSPTAYLIIAGRTKSDQKYFYCPVSFVLNAIYV